MSLFPVGVHDFLCMIFTIIYFTLYFSLRKVIFCFYFTVVKLQSLKELY
jgi:hypothetical protein